MVSLVKESKRLMKQQTEKNKSPAWLLTEIAVTKGKELSRKYEVSEELVVSSLYLAHLVFDKEFSGRIQRGHTRSSAALARKYLDKWKVSEKKQKIILNAVEAHHDHVPTKSLVAEVVKNADCFKFVTVKGCIIFLHELGLRKTPFKKSVNYVLRKMNQKKKLLTLKDCKREAEKNCRKIIEIFKSFS
ncbi:hypothetical protein JXA85_00085 [Candidatus Woesearchaeota archaeon]|nr:hypothetical protein [Candidatus Woesearchaeota archaeon]